MKLIVKCRGGTKKQLADLKERQKALRIEITQEQMKVSINVGWCNGVAYSVSGIVLLWSVWFSVMFS